jgi:hypothetical protein
MSKFNYFFILYLFLYLVNHVAFILYNYTWFSLLCTINIIELYSTFNLFSSSVFLYKYNIDYLTCSTNQLDIFYNYFYERWNLFTSLVPDISIIPNLYIDFVSFSEVLDNWDHIYCIYFDTKVVGNTNIYFYILQHKLFVIPGETSLCFFRLCNNNAYSVQSVTIYTISPFELIPFINKIQCFCFEQMNIHPYDTIELPVLFALSPNVIFLNFISITEICIEYTLVCSKTL